MLPAQHDHDRIKKATPDFINREIESKMWNRVAGYIHHPEEITRRIEALEKEWDIERYLGMNMSVIALSGITAAAVTKNKTWLVLPATVLCFFLQHAVQG